MTITKLTKSKATELLSLLTRSSLLSETMIYVNDVIVPTHEQDGYLIMGSETENGTHYIHNHFITLHEPDTPYILDAQNFKMVRERLKQTGIKSIELVNVHGGISLDIDNTSYSLLHTFPIDKIGFDYKLYYSDILSIVDSKSERIYYKNNILPIINGSVITLQGIDPELGKVRISRTNFPLTGTVKKDDEKALEFSYSTFLSNVGSTIALVVKYKKIEAIHMYGYVIYE